LQGDFSADRAPSNPHPPPLPCQGRGDLLNY
jgi:hypothetical protein